MISTTFSSLPLPADLLTNLDSLGYRGMTPIQAQNLSLVLQGHNLIAQTKTDNGKTVTFGLALLSLLNPRYFGCQALVLCPTRESADQVVKEIRRLTCVANNIKVPTFCGGVSYGPQVAPLGHGAHVVVGIPGRIQERLRKGTLTLGGFNTPVLDETDRMLDMGFYDSITGIISQLLERRQTLLSSAIYPDGIERLVKTFMRDPRQVKVESLHADNQIKWRFFEIDPKRRVDAVIHLFRHFRSQSCVTLCQARQQRQKLTDAPKAQRISVLALRGDLEQCEHGQVLTVLANRSRNVLAAIDVVAHGLDIAALETVINVELTRDPGVHIHRIGRSGRVDEGDLALSLMVLAEANRVQAIEDLWKQPLVWYAFGQSRASPEPLLLPMSILCIAGGRKDKVRPGNLLDALTGDTGPPGSAVGKIAISDFQAFVAVECGLAHQALKRLNEGKIKGHSLKVRLLQRATALPAGPASVRDIAAG